MKKFYRKNRKLLLVLSLILLAAAIVWAAAELSGQANSLAQDAGSNSAGMEMTTLNTVKPPAKTKDSPQPPACDWAKERQIKGALDRNDASYKQLTTKAKSEMSGTGKVSPATQSALMSSAREFKSLCDQYATMWDACKCYTRGKTARATGNSRIKSAEVLAAGLDQNKMNQMQSAQTDMKNARREYVQSAVDGGEISDADKADIKSNVVPQIQTLLGQSESLVTGVTRLLGDIQGGITSGVSQATTSGISSLTDMAKSATTGGGTTSASAAASSAKTKVAAASTTSLLQPVQALLSLATSLFDGVKSLFSDAQSLISGGAAGAAAGLVTGDKKMSPCFVGASED
ncbi:MAG: hypothetical protein HQK55_07265 [Deltaproteobacteria bacterium]|nr:hypothetical protein [Deltaproteobacteria bacterium]